MKQFLSYMIVALAALWMAGCSDDSLSPADQPERGIVIRLSTGDLETRTDLTSQANLQHVRKVYALLYDGTGTLVDSPELLMDVDETSQAWDPTEGGSYNDINGEEFVLPQTKTAGLEAGSYTILCVGLDDNSGATYGLTAGTMNWPTLAVAKATLAAGKTADDIAHAELFAGWSGFDFEPDNINIVEVEMKRRVAGVLCYLKDIPYKLNKGNNTYRITEIRLNLMKKQNNQISLLRKEVTKDNLLPDDFGEYNESAQATDELICSFDLKDYKPDTGNELYVIDNKGKSQLDNTLLKGAFILPIQGEAGKNTLELELLGYEYDDTNTTTHIKDQSSLTKVVTFPVEWESASSDAGEDSKSYSIRPNYIYHIGDKPDSDDTTGDYPMSLAGTKITVKPEPWTEMDVDVDFPSVPVNATMEFNKSFSDNYIFEAFEDELLLTIRPSITKKGWKLRVLSENGEPCDWIKFKGNNGQFTNELSCEKNSELAINGCTLQFQIEDYAVRRDYGDYASFGFTSAKEFLLNDIRVAKVELMTLNDDNSESSSFITQVVKQYNAITVQIEGGEYRGFSRFDYGVTRNLDGDVIELGASMQWGYMDVIAGYIYQGGAAAISDYDGEENYMNAAARGHKDFSTSAIKIAYKTKIDFSSSMVSEFWYLPAWYELLAFLSFANDYGAADLNVRVRIDDSNIYWTSGAVSGRTQYTYTSYLDSKGNVAGSDGGLDAAYQYNNRSDYFYVRRACHF